jgi:hypothetical protein
MVARTSPKMSRMRLASSATALALVFVAASAGCARVDVHSPSIRGIGYVRLDEIVKHHPLYGQLSQLDDGIAAINLAAMPPHVPRSAAEVAKDVTVLNAQLKAAQDRANKILAQKQADYARKEQAAVAAALAAAGEGNAGAGAAQQLSAASAQQAQAASRQANSDYMAYQQSVLAQNNAAFQSVSGQLQQAANRKFAARAQQLAQSESTLALQLSQSHASQRLAIQTKLNNLAMDSATRAQLRAQMADLDRKEAAAIADQRSRDQQQLAAYKAQLQAQTSQQMSQQAGKMRSQTQALLESRRNQVTAALRSLGPAPLPKNLSPATQAKVQQIHQQFAAAFQADAARTVDEYNTSKADLDRQYAALHGADVGATGLAAKQLASLQKQRSDLYDKIVAQIKSETARIAQDRGLNVVFADVEATPGGYDLTAEVTKDIESLHE